MDAPNFFWYSLAEYTASVLLLYLVRDATGYIIQVYCTFLWQIKRFPGQFWLHANIALHTDLRTLSCLQCNITEVEIFKKSNQLIFNKKGDLVGENMVM